MEGQSLLYMENRLASRITFCEFDKTLAGPIKDERGTEQGGVSSSDTYKIYNNELLSVAQQSKLGVELSSGVTVSAVGQADDCGLLSNDLTKLALLLHLAKEYCIKFNVELSSSKTHQRNKVLSATIQSEWESHRSTLVMKLNMLV